MKRSDGARYLESMSGKDAIVVAIDKRKIVVLLSVYAPFIALAILTRLSHNPLVDERVWHLPTIEWFTEQLPRIDIRSYHTSSGPVPYIVWAALGKLFGVDLRILRLSTLLCGFGYVAILWRMLSRERPTLIICVLALIVLNPYCLTYSFTIYTMVMSLFFALAGGLAFERATESRRVALLAVYSLFTALAVLSRQIYVSYALGTLSCLLLSRAWPWDSSRIRTRAAGLALLWLPVALLALLFLHWGGTTPPALAHLNATRGINLRQIDFLFIFLGFWCFPAYVDNFRRIPWQIQVAALVVSFHLLLTPLYVAEVGVVEGLIAKLTLILSQRGIPLVLLRLSHMLLWTMGLSVFYLLAKTPRRRYLHIVVSHYCVLLFIPQVWERYYLPIVPILWLGLRHAMRDLRIYGAWLLPQAAMALLYFLYKIEYISL